MDRDPLVDKNSRTMSAVQELFGFKKSDEE